MDISNTSLLSYQYHQEEALSAISIQKKHKNSDNVVSLNSSAYSMKESYSISITDGNQTLAFVYERAISAIQVEITQISKDNPAVASYLNAQDYSPEATATRIVSFATSFLGIHKANHKDMSDQEALNSFMEIIGNAIDKGFSEARDILEPLNVLQGSIKENIDTTYRLVQEKLTQFKDSLSIVK